MKRDKYWQKIGFVDSGNRYIKTRGFSEVHWKKRGDLLVSPSKPLFGGRVNICIHLQTKQIAARDTEGNITTYPNIDTALAHIALTKGT